MKFLFIIAFMQAAADGAAVALLDKAAADDIFNDSRLLALCLIGSTIGGLLSLAAFPPGDMHGTQIESSTNFRRECIKAGASMLGGLVVTPGTMQWMNIRLTSSMVVFCSAIVAMVVVSVVHTIAPQVPALTNFVLEVFKKRISK